MVAFSGCIETPDAQAARISNDLLTLYGWEQIGDTVYERHNHSVMGMFDVSVNIAKISYQNVDIVDNITNQIDVQIKLIKEAQNIPPDAKLPDVPQYNITCNISTIDTIRITSPAGIELPSEAILEVINPMIEAMLVQFNIVGFEKINTTELIIDDNSIAILDTYTGKILIDDTLMNVNIFIATWAASGSNIVVIGSVPTGEMEVKRILDVPIVVTIDGNQEMYEMIDMVKSIT